MKKSGISLGSCRKVMVGSIDKDGIIKEDKEHGVSWFVDSYFRCSEDYDCDGLVGCLVVNKKIFNEVRTNCSKLLIRSDDFGDRTFLSVTMSGVSHDEGRELAGYR